jgi:hypothetical protein
MAAKDFFRRVARTKPVMIFRSLLENKLQIRPSHGETGTPKLSVVVVVYNIPREAPRTLLSLSAKYQRHIHPDDYEVIVVDNGSSPAVDPATVASFGNNFRLIRIDPAPPSPAHAVNRGILAARGDIIGVMIDGARIASPGLLHFAQHGARLFNNAVVATLGWYLGYDFQSWSIRCGYDQAREDALLASIEWPQDGYRLFEISTLDESSVEGWFCPIAESNALFMKRELWAELQGVDERFDAPGGGLVNLDLFDRALRLPDAQLVILLGEGTFHQVHGGVATNALPENQPADWRRWAAQYEQIRGRPYEVPVLGKPPAYVGTLSPQALLHFARAAIAPVQHRYEPPLGRAFNRDLWTVAPPIPSVDPTIASLLDLAHSEFRSGHYAAVVSIARLIRNRAPDEPEAQRLLSLVACGLEQNRPSGHVYDAALAEAYRLLARAQDGPRGL